VSLSETLQNELVGDGIGVTLVCPSFFKTNLDESMRTPDPHLHAAMKRLLDRSALTADDVAEAVFVAVEKKVFYVLPHQDGRAAWLMKRLLPRKVYGRVLARQTRSMFKKREA
jgi:short-subunit dehydrogenase